MLVTGDPIDWVIESLTTRAKVLMLTATWNRYLIDSGHPYTFGTLTSPLETAGGLFKVIKEREPAVKTVYYLGFNAKYDQNAASWAKKNAEALALNGSARPLSNSMLRTGRGRSREFSQEAGHDRDRHDCRCDARRGEDDPPARIQGSAGQFLLSQGRR